MILVTVVEPANKIEELISFYKNLGIDIENSEHPVSIRINRAMSEVGLSQEIIINRLNFLAKSLIIIKAYDEKIYNSYLKKVINNRDLSVLGFIFEINQCAHIIKTCFEESLDFRLGNHNNNEPDFFVNNVGIETTSCWFSDKQSKNNPGNKLLKKFSEKNQKKYANPNSLLIIEISHISHFALQNESNVDIPFLRAQNIIQKESKFGLVICLNEWLKSQKKSFRSNLLPIQSIILIVHLF